MTYTVSITSQGQLNLPIQVRRDFDLLKANKALISVEKGRIIIEPVKDIIQLRGSLKTTIKANSQQIRSAFEKYLTNDAVRK